MFRSYQPLSRPTLSCLCCGGTIGPCSSLSPAAPFAHKRSSPRQERLSLPSVTNHQPPLTNLFRIRTYAKRARNSFGIRTYKTQHLKPFRMNTYKKRGGGALSSLKVLSTLWPRVSAKPRVTTYQPGSPSSGSQVLLRPLQQSARIGLVTALAATRETSPLRPVSKEVRADIGFGIRKLPYPVASRSRQLRDRTRKKAWVHRSKVEPTSRVTRFPDRVGKAGSVRLG